MVGADGVGGGGRIECTSKDDSQGVGGIFCFWCPELLNCVPWSPLQLKLPKAKPWSRTGEELKKNRGKVRESGSLPRTQGVSWI